MPATPALPARHARAAAPAWDAPIARPQVPRAGLAALGLAVVANALVRLVAVDGLGIGRNALQLAWGPVVGFTVMGAILAVLALWAMARRGAAFRS